MLRGQLGDGAGLRRLRVLDVLRLIHHHTLPRSASQQLFIQPRQGKRCDDYIVLRACSPKCRGLLGSAATLVDQCAQVRGEAFDLFTPVAQHRGGGNEQSGLARPLLRCVPPRAARLPAPSCPAPCHRPDRDSGPAAPDSAARRRRVSDTRAATRGSSRGPQPAREYFCFAAIQNFLQFRLVLPFQIAVVLRRDLHQIHQRHLRLCLLPISPCSASMRCSSCWSSSIHWPRNWTSGVLASTNCSHSAALRG